MIKTLFTSKPFIMIFALILYNLYVFPVKAETPIAVLVLNSSAEAIQSEADLLTDRIRFILVNSNQYKVMERDLVARLLKEQGFQSTQLCEGRDCRVKIGRLLAVRQIVTGGLTRLGQTYTLNLRLIDVESGQILKESVQDCNCLFEEVLSQSTLQVVSKLFKVQLNEAVSKALNNVENMPVRLKRPTLTFLEGGLPLPHPQGVAFGGFQQIRYGSLGALYSLNPYVALGGQLGLEDLYTSVNAFGSAHARIYTNPHNLAGFFDFGLGLYSLSFAPTVTARAGVEYRDDTGFTLGGSGGYTQGLLSRRNIFSLEYLPYGFSLEFFVGYAF